MISKEGGPSPFQGQFGNSSDPEAWRLQACGMTPIPHVGQVVSLQFSKRNGGGQRLSKEGEAGGQGQG